MLGMPSRQLDFPVPIVILPIVENGSSWVRPLPAHPESVCECFPHSWEEHPVEAIKRNLWIRPFHMA